MCAVHGLKVYLRRIEGLTLVEGGMNGDVNDYATIGYIGTKEYLKELKLELKLGPDAAKRCMAEETQDAKYISQYKDGKTVVFRLNYCSSLSQVRWIRFVRLKSVRDKQVSGSATIDTVEALSMIAPVYSDAR